MNTNNRIANYYPLIDKIIQLIALRWMNTFLEQSGRSMMPFTANILVAVLPCLAFESDKDGMMNVFMNVYLFKYYLFRYQENCSSSK